MSLPPDASTSDKLAQVEQGAADLLQNAQMTQSIDLDFIKNIMGLYMSNPGALFPAFTDINANFSHINNMVLASPDKSGTQGASQKGLVQSFSNLNADLPAPGALFQTSLAQMASFWSPLLSGQGSSAAQPLSSSVPALGAIGSSAPAPEVPRLTQDLYDEISQLRTFLRRKEDRVQNLEKHIRELQTELRTGIRTNQVINEVVADRDRYRLAVRIHRQKIQRMMKSRSLGIIRSQGTYQNDASSSRIRGSTNQNLTAPTSSNARLNDMDDFITTAIIQRSGARFEPAAPSIQNQKPEDHTSEVEGLNGYTGPAREEAERHIAKPEVRNVYRYLKGHITCLFNPRKRAFPQVVRNVPRIETLQRYEFDMTGRQISKFAAYQRKNELIAEQRSQLDKMFIEVVARRREEDVGEEDE